MIIVTGGAGFIGSNIVHALNQRGVSDILVVDDLSEGKKFFNIASAQIADYTDYEDFITAVRDRSLDQPIECIYHMGACSTTTEWDGRYMMRNNYEYSKILYHFCNEKNIPYLYASSAAVYGDSTVFKEDPAYENPLNVYGYSKLLFDQYIRRQNPKCQVVGFRFFNVYGPRETHKGSMASVAFHHNTEWHATGKVKLFGAHGGYDAGQQKRDFVFVKDVVEAMIWFQNNPQISDIFNLGTGSAQPFQDIATTTIEFHGSGEIEYIEFPEHLKGSYQSFTQANIEKLRSVGCPVKFHTVQEGVFKYMQFLNLDSQSS
jgi:ADP-L-glycero-D-manno-heptose 6-epimerase